MKDIVIPVKRQITEIKTILCCFVLANILNIVSIIVYGTEWKEIFTQALVICILTGVLYGLSIVLRVLYYGAKLLLKK